MRVQSVSPILNNYSKRDCELNRKNVNFKNIYNPKLVLNRINPLMRFMDSEYKHSIVAARATWLTVSKDIEQNTKVVNIDLDGKKQLLAWDIKNEVGDNKYVIVLHGFSHNISCLQPLYKAIINETKFSVLAPEYTGYQKNDTEDVYMNPFSLTKDIKSSIEYLKSKGIEEKDIILLGHSFGGYLAARTAGENKNLGGVVLVSTIDSMLFEARGIDGKNRKYIPQSVVNMVKNYKICRYYLSNILRIDKFLKKTEVPVDIIHGRRDSLVPLNIVKNFASKCKNLCDFKILDGGKHRMDAPKIETIVSVLNKK